MSDNQQPVIFKNCIQKWHIYIMVFAIITTVLRLLANWLPYMTESIYSQGIYPYIAFLFSIIGRLFSSSAGEIVIALFLLSLTCLFLYKLYFAISHRSIKEFLYKAIIHVAIILALIYISFSLVWGLNYHRLPLAISLKMDLSQELPGECYERMAQDMVFLIHEFHSADFTNPTPEEEIDKAVISAISFAYEVKMKKPPATKSLSYNEFMNLAGISGIFLPIAMEPHINSDLSFWEKPVVTAHEKAHYYGFASETDANFVAYIACLTSDKKILRYSAALKIFLSLSHYLPREKWRYLAQKLPPQVKKDVEERYQRIIANRLKYSLVQGWSSRINDSYLKLNSQKLGIAAYRAALPQFIRWWYYHRGIIFVEN